MDRRADLGLTGLLHHLATGQPQRTRASEYSADSYADRLAPDGSDGAIVRLGGSPLRNAQPDQAVWDKVTGCQFKKQRLFPMSPFSFTEKVAHAIAIVGEPAIAHDGSWAIGRLN